MQVRWKPPNNHSLCSDSACRSESDRPKCDHQNLRSLRMSLQAHILGRTSNQQASFGDYKVSSLMFLNQAQQWDNSLATQIGIQISQMLKH